MAPFADLEYFRLPPRWLFVKITDTEGNVGWGEATLEGVSIYQGRSAASCLLCYTMLLWLDHLIPSAIPKPRADVFY